MQDLIVPAKTWRCSAQMAHRQRSGFFCIPPETQRDELWRAVQCCRKSAHQSRLNSGYPAGARRHATNSSACYRRGGFEKHVERVLVKSAGRARVLNVSEIDWLGAAVNYIELHAGSGSYLLRR